MSTNQQGTDSNGTQRYRMVLEGELNAEWGSWFGAERVTAAAGRTMLELSVADQAALHGVLRRVHDLHLRLVSLTRVDNE